MLNYQLSQKLKKGKFYHLIDTLTGSYFRKKKEKKES
jgi:hypothetical protein